MFLSMPSAPQTSLGEQTWALRTRAENESTQKHTVNSTHTVVICRDRWYKWNFDWIIISLLVFAAAVSSVYANAPLYASSTFQKGEL